MSSLTTKQKIDSFIKDLNINGITKGKDFKKEDFNHLYVLGKKIEHDIPDVIDKRKQYGSGAKNIEFKYVSWKWYEYILRKIDNDFWWELTNYSDNYKMVKVKIIWLGKEYSGWYAVEDSAIKKDTKEPLNNLGEMVVNEGMRCLAKICSRATGLFLHLWLEGSND